MNRVSRARGPRSRRKDRVPRRQPRRTCDALVFVGAAGFTAVLWGALQQQHVPGPWSRASRWRGKDQSSMEMLRDRHATLLARLKEVDKRLTNQNHFKKWIPEGTADINEKSPSETLAIRGGDGSDDRIWASDDDSQERMLPDLESRPPEVVAQSAEEDVRDSEGGGEGEGKSHPYLRIPWKKEERGGTGTDPRVDMPEHYILSLSTEDFAATPVNEMMSHYRSEKCDWSFGNGLVDAWRERRETCCREMNVPNSVDDLEPSSITCHLIHQDDHHGNGDNLVNMRNVQLELDDFADRSVTSGVMERFVRSMNMEPCGFWCQMARAFAELPFFRFHDVLEGLPAWLSLHALALETTGWNDDWTTRAFESVDELQCDEWVEHPVLIVQRDTFANLFHDSEDFVNAFLAMAILRMAPGETQIFITDLYPKGPFAPMWDKVFGVGKPTLLAWDVGRLYAGKKVCFRDLTIGIYGPAAPTTLARLVTKCYHTALVRSYADFVIRGLELHKETRYASPPKKRVVVTWIARRSSVQWPERTYCSEDGASSFFTCEYFNHLHTRDLQRTVKNEQEVLQALRMLETETFANGAQVEVRDMDYNLLSFEDQIKNDLDTDIMVGPHGAGLYHIIFTPDRASLVELKIDNTIERKHFVNLAYWSGHKYKQMGGPSKVQVESVKALVADAISEMDLSQN